MAERIAVVFNDDRELAGGVADDAIAVAAVADCARAVAEGLAARGFSTELLAARGGGRDVLGPLEGLHPELVFNLVESLDGDGRKAQGFAWMLELAGFEYTGARPRSMALCIEKPVARAVLAARGVRVPAGRVLEHGAESLAGLAFPVIVKPAHEDASHGIDAESVARDESAARARARWVIEHYAQAALVEEFVEGRELNLALLGEGADVRVLSFGEIDFSLFPPRAPRIVTYAGKWIEGSEDWERTLTGAAKALTGSERAELEGAARGAYSALGLTDYGRVDLRLDRAGRAFVIDVNDNPDLSPGAGFALAAEREGIHHAQLVETIARGALARRAARARGR